MSDRSALLNRLENGIKELYQSEKYTQYLKTMSKFHNYSFNNSLLILMQKPDATHVAGYTSWKTNFKRQVNRGEKGIQILAPATYKQKVEMQKIDPDTQQPVLDSSGKPVTEIVDIQKPYFKPVYVFDISQTSGEPLPEIAPELQAKVENFDTFYKALERVTPYKIERENIQTGAKGYCDYTNKRIAIKEGLSEAHTIKTGIHEIAHAMMHSLDRNNPDGKNRRVREVEAESVAFVVSSHYGIDTSDYSFGYIASWSNDKELKELKSSLTTIQQTANKLINDIDKAYKEIQLTKDHEKLRSMDDGEVDLNRVKDEKLYAPVVKIEWSEHSAFKSGEKLSLAEADRKFKAIDSEVLKTKQEAAAKGEYEPYYKTRYEINCVYQGAEYSMGYRQDLGDGLGGLTDYLAIQGDAPAFTAYLKQHSLLEKMQDLSASELPKLDMILHSNASADLKAEAQQHYDYHKAVLEYVETGRSKINAGEHLPDPPRKEDFVKGRVHENKLSIKERMELAKDRSDLTKGEPKSKEIVR